MRGQIHGSKMTPRSDIRRMDISGDMMDTLEQMDTI